jgi:hypothetical protein
MRSPVSQGALGECNAIRSRGFSRSELTFVGIMESDSGAFPMPSVLRRIRGGRSMPHRPAPGSKRLREGKTRTHHERNNEDQNADGFGCHGEECQSIRSCSGW